jgi:hypothetical protein
MSTQHETLEIDTIKAYQYVPCCVTVNLETNFPPGGMSRCETPGTPSDHDVPCCLFLDECLFLIGSKDLDSLKAVIVDCGVVRQVIIHSYLNLVALIHK